MKKAPPRTRCAGAQAQRLCVVASLLITAAVTSGVQVDAAPCAAGVEPRKKFAYLVEVQSLVDANTIKTCKVCERLLSSSWSSIAAGRQAIFGSTDDTSGDVHLLAGSQCARRNELLRKAIEKSALQAEHGFEYYIFIDANAELSIKIDLQAIESSEVGSPPTNLSDPFDAFEWTLTRVRPSIMFPWSSALKVPDTQIPRLTTLNWPNVPGGDVRLQYERFNRSFPREANGNFRSQPRHFASLSWSWSSGLVAFHRETLTSMFPLPCDLWKSGDAALQWQQYLASMLFHSSRLACAMVNVETPDDAVETAQSAETFSLVVSQLLQPRAIRILPASHGGAFPAHCRFARLNIATSSEGHSTGPDDMLGYWMPPQIRNNVFLRSGRDTKQWLSSTAVQSLEAFLSCRAQNSGRSNSFSFDTCRA